MATASKSKSKSSSSSSSSTSSTASTSTGTNAKSGTVSKGYDTKAQEKARKGDEGTYATPEAPVSMYLRPRSDEDALYGHFCTVTNGEHKGLYGVYEETLTLDSDGYPDLVGFRPRDATGQLIEVKYEDLARDFAGGRR